jgi:hypothetical protein
MVRIGKLIVKDGHVFFTHFERGISFFRGRKIVSITFILKNKTSFHPYTFP